MTHRARVLIVDDNDADVFICKRMFAREAPSERAEILTARDGEHALQIMRQCRADRAIPNLVLVDINMPRMTGFEFLEAWRDEAQGNDVPVRFVLLTSSTDERDRQRADACGVQEYLVKPPTRDAIRALLASSTAD